MQNINEIILALTILLIPQPYKPNLLSLNFYIFYVLPDETCIFHIEVLPDFLNS